ncbi:MAG: hypothetical protein AAB374_00035 [Patescibacteria group bacterium]
MATQKTKLDPRIHFVAVTAIIAKGNKFLIAKRAGWEKAFPNTWTVPGGKFVFGEYPMKKAKSGYPQKYNVVNWVVRNEVKEEVGLEIEKPEYLCDLVFVRPDGFPVVTLSFWAKYKSGKIKLADALVDYAWVTLAEAKKYDLIDGIWDELKEVSHILKKNH